ncbi:hypothetical protein ACIOHO_37370 [Streptomyces sp. NPDC087849]|uniref:hypothetical protein n=1 Tax=Streptomyces sp. NPDC087849 TaxID=3365808 RepID=UPI0037F45782
MTAGVRRQLLALDAARYGDRELAARITAVPVSGGTGVGWGVEWATGGMVDHRLRQALVGHTDEVFAVATGVVDGRPVAVTSGADGEVRVWDLTTGRQVGPELVFPAAVWAMAVTPDGRLVVGFGWEVSVLTRC